MVAERSAAGVGGELSEATCRSVEIAQIGVSGLDLEGRHVWISGGRTTAPRGGGYLTAWGAGQLCRRVETLPDDPATRVVAESGRIDEVTRRLRDVDLGHPLVWRQLRSLVRHRFPDDQKLWLPEASMRRDHYRYARTRWPTDPGILAKLRVMHWRPSRQEVWGC